MEDTGWANEMSYNQSQSMRAVLCTLVQGLEVTLPWGKNEIRIRMDQNGKVYYHATVIHLGKSTEKRWIVLNVLASGFFAACQKLTSNTVDGLLADIVLNEHLEAKRETRKRRSH